MITLAVLVSCATPLDRPIDVAFDHTACAHCSMLVSDPRFAAQLATVDGERPVFDDPACLFRYVADHHPSIAGVWFHDSAGDGWLSWREVGFVPDRGAPMNGGWAAVSASTPQSVTFGAASSAVLSGASR